MGLWIKEGELKTIIVTRNVAVMVARGLDSALFSVSVSVSLPLFSDEENLLGTTTHHLGRDVLWLSGCSCTRPTQRLSGAAESEAGWFL